MLLIYIIHYQLQYYTEANFDVAFSFLFPLPFSMHGTIIVVIILVVAQQLFFKFSFYLIFPMSVGRERCVCVCVWGKSLRLTRLRPNRFSLRISFSSHNCCCSCLSFLSFDFELRSFFISSGEIECRSSSFCYNRSRREEFVQKKLN